MGSLPAALPGGSGAEEGEGRGRCWESGEGAGGLPSVARVPGMGGRLVTLTGQPGVGGGGVWARGTVTGEVTETFLRVAP